MKKIIILFLLFFITSTPTKASEYDDYVYTSSKQDNGLTYELTKVDLTTESLYLEGWAYIPDAQHYNDNNDIKITIMSYESGGEKTYYNTVITNKYDLTAIEKYSGVDYCSENVYNQDPGDCAYYYKYVSFSVSIPIEQFTFPHTYEFYIFVEAKNAHIKRYTKLYSPNVEDSIVVGNYKYSFISDVEDTDLVVNDPHVFVRTTPEKTDDNMYVKNGCTYYWHEDESYKSTSKTFNHPITWYSMGFYESNEEDYGGCLAKNGTSKSGFIASNFVDFQGYGNSTLIIETLVDFSIDLVAIPTINKTDNVIIQVEVSATNITEPLNVDVKLKYGTYEATQTLTFENNETKQIEFIIDPMYYQKNVPITIELLVNDTNMVNNRIEIMPFYAVEAIEEVNLKSNENLISYSVPSGIVYSNEETKVYNETITINIQAPVEQVQEELNNFNASFDNFYAGGAFEYNFQYNYTNDYPYNYTKEKTITPVLEIDESYIDNPKGKINYILDNGVYKLEPVYINENNVISYTNMGDALYPDGKNVIYTSFDLAKGQYDFQVQINDVGINKIDLRINSYFVIEGILFSHSSNALLYYRTISPINPMPNYTSQLWENYNLEYIFDDESKKEINIYLTKEGKQTIKSWVEEDYQNNINANDEEFKNLIDEMIKNDQIFISEGT